MRSVAQSVTLKLQYRGPSLGRAVKPPRLQSRERLEARRQHNCRSPVNAFTKRKPPCAAAARIRLQLLDLSSKNPAQKPNTGNWQSWNLQLGCNEGLHAATKPAATTSKSWCFRTATPTISARRVVAEQVGVPETQQETQTNIPLTPSSSGREASSPRYQKKPSRATQEGAASRRESLLKEHVKPTSLQTGVAEGTC